MSIKRNNKSKHSYFMQLALNQANINLGFTKENPSVGCVIVKNNIVISSGYTGRGGRPHAENIAINKARVTLKNSELYSTLEPCSHYGKTPPCVNLISKKKIKKVFYSINDPDNRSHKKCDINLSKSKITTNKGALSKESNIFYRSYKKYKKDNLPFVTLKMALSKDFFTINKKKQWITNEYSRGRVHLLRSQHDCIITSAKTVLADDPMLDCRINGLKDKSPSRIILDANLKTPINSKLIKTAKKHQTFILYSKSNKKKIKILNSLKVKTKKIPMSESGELDLYSSLMQVKKLGYTRILLEVGPKLFTNFLKLNLVDDLKLFISKNSLKKSGKSNVKPFLSRFLRKRKTIKEKVNLFGEQLKTYYIK